MAVAPDEQARVAALELDGIVSRGGELLVGRQSREHPADRRLALRRALRVDRARHDQPVDRPRHRHVVEAKPLRPLLVLARRPHVLVAEDGPAGACRGMDDAKAETPVREREDLLR